MSLRLSGVAVAIALGCSVPAVAEQVYSVDPRNPLLRVLDPGDASTVRAVTMTLEGFTVEGATGLAAHPATLELWALIRAGSQQRELARIDPDTGVATRIGTTDRPGLTGLAFAGDGTLYAVTGDGGDPPETLFRVSTVDATTTFVAALGAGDDGEALGYNPQDGRLYHASGIAGDCDSPIPGQGVCFEAIDPATLMVTPIDIRGTALIDEEAFALAWREADGAFLWAQGGAAPLLFRVTPTGGVTLVGPLEDGHASKGIAVVNRVPTGRFAVSFATGDRLVWPEVPCAETYNVYRKVAPRLTDSSGDGVADDYGACFAAGLVTTQVIDRSEPAEGGVQFYLVTASNDLGEGDPGSTSAAVIRPAPPACR